MPQRPNILVFFTDQQRWDTCGCYGQELDVTPNLDRMAGEGVKFENAFTCQPLCGPARACLQTGKYATETGCYRNGFPLPKHERTIARMLSETGYETAYIGKWHLASAPSAGSEHDYRTKPVPPELRGGYTDYWLASDLLESTSNAYQGHLFNGSMEKVGFKGYRVDSIADFAIEYLKTRSKERPFFLFLSFLEPHHQNDERRYPGPPDSKTRFGDYKVPGDLQGTEGDWRENFPDYLGCCASLDYNLERIRNTLLSLGLLDNTLMIYTSDHGSHFRTRNHEYKRSCHESSIRIPLVINGPGFKKAEPVHELASLIDIAPTIAYAAGCKIPASMRGRSLQEIEGGFARQRREEVFIQISESQLGRCLRSHDWKYSVKAPLKDYKNTPASFLYTEDCLYDLKNDPHERKNLVSEQGTAAIRKILSEKLMDYIQKVENISARILPQIE